MLIRKGIEAAEASNVVNYGSTDEGSHGDAVEIEECSGRDRCPQSSPTPISNVRQSITTIATTDPRKDTLHSRHTMSTLALCSSVLSMVYVLMSVFPYSGFMSVRLVPGLTLNSAGTHAGALSGSWAIGRAFSAWSWGVACDVYGRKFVLLFSSSSSAVLVLAFGLSTTYRWAIATRALTGMLNGTMVAARVAATELSGGNCGLEARGMGLVISMIGFGTLVGPALGGALSEPLTQYPNVDFGGAEDFLAKYPFVLPNIAGALLCVLSTILVALLVEETLPEDELRSPKYIIPDVLQFLTAIPAKLTAVVLGSDCGNTGYQRVNSSCVVQEIPVNHNEDADTTGIEDGLKAIDFQSGDFGDAMAMSGRSSRASFAAVLRRSSTHTRASIPTKTPGTAIRCESKSSTMSSHSQDRHSIGSLMRSDHIRQYLNCYWTTTLATTAASQCFPLFAMATVGGLGVGETTIGIIGAGSGLLFVTCQYFVFAASMKRLGLHRTMVSSCLLAVPPVILIPLSLLFKDRTAAIVAYLSVLNGAMLVAASNWNAALTIAQNRAVEAPYRARLNALGAIGGSLARGAGPIIAGLLVNFSYTSGIIPAGLGSLVVYSIVAGIGVIAFIMNLKLEDRDL